MKSRDAHIIARMQEKSDGLRALNPWIELPDDHHAARPASGHAPLASFEYAAPLIWPQSIERTLGKARTLGNDRHNPFETGQCFTLALIFILVAVGRGLRPLDCRNKITVPGMRLHVA